MTEHCPFYKLKGPGEKGAIVIGSERCLAGSHQMCGKHAVCPGAVAAEVGASAATRKQQAASLAEEAAETDERLDWSAAGLDEAGPTEAEAPPAESPCDETAPAAAEGETLGEALRRLRNEKGFTMVNLARAVDLPFYSVSRWEAGASKPMVDSLRKLDQALGSNLVERFGAGLLGSRKTAKAPEKKKLKAFHPAPPAATVETVADRPLINRQPVPAAASARPEPAGGREDFIREILREASLARKEFNLILLKILAAARDLDFK